MTTEEADREAKRRWGEHGWADDRSLPGLGGDKEVGKGEETYGTGASWREAFRDAESKGH